MMYTLDASGTTTAPGTLTPLWPAAVDSATRVRIQNRGEVLIHVVVALPTVNGNTPDPIYIDLSAGSEEAAGDFTDETWVDPTLAVGVISRGKVAAFTAFRMA